MRPTRRSEGADQPSARAALCSFALLAHALGAFGTVAGLAAGRLLHESARVQWLTESPDQKPAEAHPPLEPNA
jgi:hypothetical protein